MTHTNPIDPLRRYKETGRASADAVSRSAGAPTGASESDPHSASATTPASDSDEAVDLPEAGDPAVAAFFDIDNTVIRGASIFHLARGAYKRDFLTLSDLLGFAVDQIKFVLEGEEDLDAMAEATEQALSFVKGKTVEEIAEFGEEIYDRGMASKMWPGTIALAQHHLTAGQRVWLVSATPVEIARVVGERLGLTGAMGTVSQTRDGVYTGRLLGHPLHGIAKAEAVRALAADEGLDLSRCYAYSDSANDMPLLTAVGHPVAVNPDAELKEAARDNRWPIYDFRGRRQWRRYKLPAVVAGTAAAGVLAGYGLGAVNTKKD